MNNININNTLAELEDNLKRMDSARTQVSNLGELVSQLTDAYSKTLKQLQGIENSIHYDEKYFENKFGKSISELDANINLLQTKVLNHNNSVNSIHDKATKEFIKSLNKSEEQVKLYINEIKPTLEKVQSEFKNKNEEIIIDLNKKIKEVVEASSEKINEIKGLSILKEINSIDVKIIEINSYFVKLFSFLESIDDIQAKSFEKLTLENNELKDVIQNLKAEFNLKSEKLDLNFKIILVAVIITFLAIIVLKFI